MNTMLPQRFWDKVVQAGDDPIVACWIWTGSISHWGYGTYSKKKAHRLSYMEMVGEIPEGLMIDHLCSQRRCVNPYHLEPVTAKENFHRGRGPEIFRSTNGDKTHCKHGHEFTDENTIRVPNGRACRECHRISDRRYYYMKTRGVA